MAVFKLLFSVAILAASLKDVKALSKENIAAWTEEIKPHIAECSKEFSIEEGTLKEAKEGGNSEGIDACFFACVGKKLEIIKDGKFDNEKALEKIKENITDADDLKNAEEVINDCASVNSEDGDECTRAKSLVQCMVKHKGMFTIA